MTRGPARWARPLAMRVLPSSAGHGPVTKLLFVNVTVIE
jgi:hypothetical protein